MTLKAGDWVEIRSKEEILATLDKNGRLDELPFMPQMLQYCGRRYQVFKHAHKTCDTVFPVRGRKMANAVHLEGIRCDGQAYGGCQAGCLIFWKDAWLIKVSEPEENKTQAPHRPSPSSSYSNCSEEQVWTGTRATNQEKEQDPAYVCQATQLP